MIVYGINPVLEALRAGRVKELRVAVPAGSMASGSSRKEPGDRLRQVLEIAADQGVPVRRVPADALDRDSRRGVHQGVVADVADLETYSVEELVRGAAAAPLLVVLDSIE